MCDNRLYFLLRVLKVKSRLLIPLYGGKSMSSETTAVAVQYRLQEGAVQFRYGSSGGDYRNADREQSIYPGYALSFFCGRRTDRIKGLV